MGGLTLNQMLDDVHRFELDSAGSEYHDANEQKILDSIKVRNFFTSQAISEVCK
jgi:hypothetical protein